MFISLVVDTVPEEQTSCHRDAVYVHFPDDLPLNSTIWSVKEYLHNYQPADFPVPELQQMLAFVKSNDDEKLNKIPDFYVTLEDEDTIGSNAWIKYDFMMSNDDITAHTGTSIHIYVKTSDTVITAFPKSPRLQAQHAELMESLKIFRNEKTSEQLQYEDLVKAFIQNINNTYIDLT